jgi:hypothetical protein
VPANCAEDERDAASGEGEDWQPQRMAMLVNNDGAMLNIGFIIWDAEQFRTGASTVSICQSFNDRRGRLETPVYLFMTMKQAFAILEQIPNDDDIDD